MSAAGFFAAARAYKRELTVQAAVGLTDEDVKILNAATVGRWKRATAPTGVSGTGDSCRPLNGRQRGGNQASGHRRAAWPID